MKTKYFLILALLHFLTFVLFVLVFSTTHSIASEKEWPPTQKIISEYFFVGKDRGNLIMVRGTLAPDINATFFNEIYWSEDAKTFFPLEIKSARLEQYQTETSEIRQKWIIITNEPNRKREYIISYSMGNWEKEDFQKIEILVMESVEEKPHEYRRTYFSCPEIKEFVFP